MAPTWAGHGLLKYAQDFYQTHKKCRDNLLSSENQGDLQ